ncbi:LssY C-terminal domain-containing protein [Yoonia sp. GPGPB17]|uniref:LssY C-terminal domain-containing protein n=1 Tax=Yoonia sp. GPGPB17 TaxID=3026147 RepID=UPI0030C476D5
MTSYVIGRRYGARFSVRFLKRHKRRSAWRRAQAEITRRGVLFIVFSRFLGPVAWVTPFLAGTLEMPRKTFLPAAALGVILGVGQFLIYGAIGAQLAGTFLPFILDHLALILLTLCMLLSALLVWQRSERRAMFKLLQAMLMAGSVFLASNMLYFFVLNSHQVPNIPRITFRSICDAVAGPFLVEPGHTGLHLPQPINVILISENAGADLMSALGWHRNVTFTHDNISFLRYVRLLLESIPPISELYLAGFPADSAHQMTGTLKVREHIRWWDMGAGVHYGAVSKTDEIAIKYYSHLPVLLHDIDPNVDRSRNVISTQVEQLQGYNVLGLAPMTPPVADDVVADYETDGQILVVAEAETELPSEIRQCLSLRSVD